ncbi:hypothetical protein BDF20DRAFT_822731, partial [Mycotypha africana]|uniref:uncharacterized protein n=1 Tax=Mycotypha africana TaxID=64632 RepID=UPI002301CFF9
RSLTLSENELLRNEFNLSKNYPLTDLIPPAELPNLINLNQFLALDIASELFNSRYAYLYLQSILESPITTNSIEVIHHVIRSCDQAPNGLKKDRQVKQVTRFIHSLLEKNIIPLSEYMIEIQAFCVTYMKVGGVANLFQSISAHNHYNRQMMLMNQFNSNVSSTASSSSTPLYF